MKHKTSGEFQSLGKGKRSRSGISRAQITNLLQNFDTAARRAIGSIEDQIEKDLRIFKINGKDQVYSPEDYIFSLAKPLDQRYREIKDQCK